MEKKTNSKKIICAVLVIFTGICFMGSTYFNTKKHKVFNDMNELYYEEVISLETNIEEINEEENELIQEKQEEIIIPEEIVEEISETTTKKQETVKTETTKKTTKKTTQAKNIYIGTLKIPTIKLERGFLSVNSKYNNVNRNIYTVPGSDMPDEENGNLMLASHSGNSSISFFKNLYKLKLADDVYLNYNGKEYHYKVRNIYTDSKTGDVKVVRNKYVNTLTLITCTKNDNKTQTIYICELVK